MTKKVFLIESKKTAIGKFLGSLYEKDVSDVCSQLISQGFRKYQKAIHDTEMVIVGNVISATTGQGIARKISIQSGIPETTPAYCINMVCGSSMQAIGNAMNEIKVGNCNVVLAGGFEFMSNIPFATNNYIRLGKKYGDFSMIDLMLHDGLLDSFSGVHMGITAENIAKKYQITREEQDDYSLLTQGRAIEAIDTHQFEEEIVPIRLKDYRNNDFVFDTDEFPNRETNKQKMAKLKPTFIKDGTGTVTAGNTSGINDGASFLLLASEDYCVEKNMKPIVELVDYVSVGCDPQFMGLGPYYAIQKLLVKNQMSFNSIDYLEINEAFAAQVLGCYKLLEETYHVSQNIIMDKCNIHGSGIALGHPLGATGARITTTLHHIMTKNTCEYGISSLCIGGGMGAALLLKKVGNI